MAALNPKRGVLPNIMWIMDKIFQYTNFGVVSTLHEDFFILSGRTQREQVRKVCAAKKSQIFFVMRHFNVEKARQLLFLASSNGKVTKAIVILKHRRDVTDVVVLLKIINGEID